MGRVLLKPPTIRTHGAQSRLRIANPLYGRTQWYEHAQAVNWLIGRGNTIVNGVPLEDAAGDYSVFPGGNVLLEHWISPHSQVKSYLWLVTLKARANGTAFGTIEDDASNQLGTWVCGAGDQARGVCLRIQQSAEPTPIDNALFLKVLSDANSLSPTFIASHAVIELPRYRLDTAPDEETCASNAPIFEADDHLSAVDGVTRLVPTARAVARRASMVSLSLPQGINVTAGSFDLVASGLVRPRCLYGETTRALSWKALVRGNGGDGEFKVSAISEGAVVTDTETVTIPSGSEYNTIGGSIDARTEDPSNLAAGGWRDDEREVVQCEARKTTGTSVDVAGFWVWEPQS